jgi:Lipocalin-like domain
VEEIMKQLCVGIVVTASLTLPAFGQASLKEQLVGAWAVVSCDLPNGIKPAQCINPNGILIMDASGRYAGITAARDRPKFSDPAQPRRAQPAEEYKAAVVGFAANFGTWTVDEASKTIVFHYEGALFPNIEGTDTTATVSLSGDELRTYSQAQNSVLRRINK